VTGCQSKGLEIEEYRGQNHRQSNRLDPPDLATISRPPVQQSRDQNSDRDQIARQTPIAESVGRRLIRENIIAGSTSIEFWAAPRSRESVECLFHERNQVFTNQVSDSRLAFIHTWTIMSSWHQNPSVFSAIRIRTPIHALISPALEISIHTASRTHLYCALRTQPSLFSWEPLPKTLSVRHAGFLPFPSTPTARSARFLVLAECCRRFDRLWCGSHRAQQNKPRYMPRKVRRRRNADIGAYGSTRPSPSKIFGFILQHPLAHSRIRTSTISGPWISRVRDRISSNPVPKEVGFAIGGMCCRIVPAALILESGRPQLFSRWPSQIVPSTKCHNIAKNNVASLAKEREPLRSGFGQRSNPSLNLKDNLTVHCNGRSSDECPRPLTHHYGGANSPLVALGESRALSVISFFPGATCCHRSWQPSLCFMTKIPLEPNLSGSY
jgi:hypothetical protein